MAEDKAEGKAKTDAEIIAGMKPGEILHVTIKSKDLKRLRVCDIRDLEHFKLAGYEEVTSVKRKPARADGWPSKVQMSNQKMGTGPGMQPYAPNMKLLNGDFVAADGKTIMTQKTQPNYVPVAVVDGSGDAKSLVESPVK